ncbi:MAG: GNAT family N-acetyltransferase [Anaerolineae bacterium]|nr:GNAT family N-acetyltransferase [Anaerolineae bacterium]
MEIATATADDIPELVELLCILFAQEAEFTPDVEAHTRALSTIIANPDIGVILVAKNQERVVGMVNLLFTVSTALGERVGLVEDMVVLPTWRGTGVGSHLLSRAVDKARECGCRRLTLLTDADNHAAHKFYERHGFVLSEMVPFRLAVA